MNFDTLQYYALCINNNTTFARSKNYAKNLHFTHVSGAFRTFCTRSEIG